jgi:Arc/MetJ-type ribon-helix-helix transcriptional regulator
MGATERLVVELPADLVAGLRASVRSGAFGSESEAVEVLLRTWYGDDSLQDADLKTLRSFVGEGIADAEAGRLSDAEDVYTRVLAHIDELAVQKGK